MHQVSLSFYFDFHFNMQVINKTCIGIRDVSPNQICLGSTDSVTLLGRGFTNDLNQSAVTCRFQTDNGHSLGKHFRIFVAICLQFCDFHVQLNIQLNQLRTTKLCAQPHNSTEQGEKYMYTSTLDNNSFMKSKHFYRKVLLQISLNGVSYISSNVTLTLSTCEVQCTSSHMYVHTCTIDHATIIMGGASRRTLNVALL